MYLAKTLASLLIILTLSIPKSVQAYSISSSPMATWLWNTQEIVNNSDKILNFLASKNVQVLYLQVNYDLNFNVYKKFIEKASNKNISVQALDGGADWVFPKGQPMQKQFFDWLIKYQNSSSQKQKFQGVHFDVEPYLNAEYAASPNKVLEGYQDFLISSINKSNALKIPINIDIPFWFDEVKYSTKYGNGVMLDWVLKNVKNVVIMAYRNNALGDNGIIKLINNEMVLAKKYKASVTVAVETQKSTEGNYLSFFETGQAAMKNQLAKVYSYYKTYPSLKGFAAHDLNNWMLLKP